MAAATIEEAHRRCIVNEYLQATFHRNIIEVSYDIDWPPRSPNLSQCDLSLNLVGSNTHLRANVDQKRNSATNRQIEDTFKGQRLHKNTYRFELFANSTQNRNRFVES